MLPYQQLAVASFVFAPHPEQREPGEGSGPHKSHHHRDSKLPAVVAAAATAGPGGGGRVAGSGLLRCCAGVGLGRGELGGEGADLAGGDRAVLAGRAPLAGVERAPGQQLTEGGQRAGACKAGGAQRSAA